MLLSRFMIELIALQAIFFSAVLKPAFEITYFFGIVILHTGWDFSLVPLNNALSSDLVPHHRYGDLITLRNRLEMI
jgi:hypothetical protein